MIETIEFVLGTISNTASYLRLWALSLAHSQLAMVFYNFILGPAVNSGSTVALFFAFPVWATVTCGVLMMMDTMECFLHVLRLHWVEFQSKFFKGEGYEFKPLEYESQFKN
jgi:V-type H+-transporting ATPase subunit a